MRGRGIVTRVCQAPVSPCWSPAGVVNFGRQAAETVRPRGADLPHDSLRSASPVAAHGRPPQRPSFRIPHSMTTRVRLFAAAAALGIAVLLPASGVGAQGVTTGAITGTVTG